MGSTREASPDPAGAAAFAAARRLCRRTLGRSYYALAFLPAAKRDAACAVVAFCGMVREAMEAPDESLDGAHGLRHHPVAAGAASGAACATCGPTGSLESRVAMLRDRLDEVYNGRNELPRPEARSDSQHTLHAFALTVRRHQVPRHYFLDLAQGLRADQTVSRYATWASLQRHCHQTAGAVALMLCAVFGVTHSGAGQHALNLATAIRLTTVLRDVKQDRARGKVYLPLEDLARFRYSERDLAAGTLNDPFRELMRFEIARARRLYHEGTEGVCWLGDDGSRLAVSAFAASSAGVLDAIERQGCDVFKSRPALTTAQQLRRLPLAWSLARRRPGERARNVFHSAR